MPKKETVRVRPARGTNDFGDPIGPVPPWTDIPGATVVPRASQEDERRGQIIIHGFMVAINPTYEVEDTDEVEVRGEVHQIEGAVADYGKRKIFYTMRAN